MNISRVRQESLGKSFPIFFEGKSWMKFNSACVCCHDWGWGSVNYLEGNFSDCQEEKYPIKRYCLPSCRGINCKLS